MTLGYNGVRQRKTVEWSDGITEQWGCCLPGQGQGHPTLDADLCPVSWFHLYIVPRSLHLKPFFKPWKLLQMGSDVRLATALLGYQWKDREGGKRGLVKLLWRSRSNLANEKSTHTHKEHKREELNNLVNKGIITLHGLIHTEDLLKTSHFKINEEH